MAYTTANGATTDTTISGNAIEQTAGASGLPVSRQDRLLRTAERLVRSLAPPPEPQDEEYPQAASDAEIAVFGFLVKTDENTVSGKSLSGVGSKSLRGYKEAVRPLVRDAMGEYYGASRNVVYAGFEPY
jgi:hypothetical protein